MEVKIIRSFPNAKQTLGKLFVINEFLIEFECHTLELAWKDNKKNESCIPTGTYTMKRRFSDKYGQHWHILDVPNRDMILIHYGNFAAPNKSDTKGCILVGMGLADINGDGYLDVTESKYAMEKIDDVLKGDEYKLTIQ